MMLDARDICGSATGRNGRNSHKAMALVRVNNPPRGTAEAACLLALSDLVFEIRA
jgi:hypothetical protein